MPVLRWRLACPSARYFVSLDDLALITTCVEYGPIRACVVLKAFPLGAGLVDATRAIRSTTRFYRAAFAVYAGFNRSVVVGEFDLRGDSSRARSTLLLGALTFDQDALDLDTFDFLTWMRTDFQARSATLVRSWGVDVAKVGVLVAFGVAVAVRLVVLAVWFWDLPIVEPGTINDNLFYHRSANLLAEGRGSQTLSWTMRHPRRPIRRVSRSTSRSSRSWAWTRLGASARCWHCGVSCIPGRHVAAQGVWLAFGSGWHGDCRSSSAAVDE